MLPYLNVFGLEIPMYGLLITCGVVLGTLVAIRFPYRKDIQKEDILYACCYAGVGVFIGAKLLYLAVTLPRLIESGALIPFSLNILFDLFRSGFVFYGGVIGGIFAVWLYTRKFKLHFWGMMETIIPSVPLIHAVGRLGCYCAGCCYGCPAEPPWGQYFTEDSLAPHGIALFPVQLLESGLNFILFILLFIYSRKPRKQGRVLGFYLSFYAVERFVLEYFRYDGVRGIFLGISTSQWISILLFPIGLYLLFNQRKYDISTE